MTLKEWLEEERRRGLRVANVSLVRDRGPARGTQDWLALKLGVDQGQVSKWVSRKSTPESYAARIVKLSGGKVTLAELARVP